MKILLVHQNFPGQYLHLARHWGANASHQVLFVTQRNDQRIAGVHNIVYKPLREVTPNVHHYLRDLEAGTLNAQQVARVAVDLRKAGFVPDIILGHNGWGEIWYLKEIFPRTPLVGYFEFFYRLKGADVGFDPSEKVPLDAGPRLRSKNLGNLLGLDVADWGQCATQWQKSLYPERYHSMLNVIHEGVDTSVVAPNGDARFTVPGSGIELRAGEEIVTYVARNLEPYRGFPSFMRSLPHILAQRPKARVLIVGGDETSYGFSPGKDRTFREMMLAELGDSLDLTRVHFLGKVPYGDFLRILQVSAVHIYLTLPFVLSWSVLEAMSAGCVVLGSQTAPVEEVIRDGENGLLVDMFSPADIATKAIEILRNPRDYADIRECARQTIIERYDLRSVCLPRQLRWIDSIVSG